MKKHFTLFILTTTLSQPVFSAGFQLYEQSTSGLSRAFAGEGSIADNASSLSTNPATLTLFKRPELSTGVIYINPNIHLSGHSALGSDLSTKNIAPVEYIPNFHLAYPINDRWSVGGSITSNFGLSTRFDDLYAAGDAAGETKLTTINANFSTAYRFDEHLSFGVGLNTIYAKAKISRLAGSEFPMAIPSSTIISELKGHKWGTGWNVGLLYEFNDNNRIGLTYRSKVDLNFNGDYKSDLPVIGTNGKSIPGKLKLNLPDIWDFSGYHRLSDPFALHYSLSYTKWNRFQELKGINTNNGDVLFFKHEGYNNTYRLALGATYYYDNNWTFRSGIALDKRASKNHPSISIPDQDRFWFTTGLTYHFNADLFVDFGLAYLSGKDINFIEKSPVTNADYNFHAKGSAWLTGLNINYRF